MVFLSRGETQAQEPMPRAAREVEATEEGRKVKLYLRKLANGTLAPDDATSIDCLLKVKIGGVVAGDFTRPRNYQWFRKWWALLQYAFDTWEPPVGPEKNFERFRKDITILAGYYDIVPRVRGEPKAEAKSISFASMEQDEFEKLYDATIAALIKFVLKNYTREDVDRVMANITEFA